MSERPRRRLALILSGGGARGAYEAGVLSYLFDELAQLRGGPPRVQILCGTSVGAINSAFLAAHMADPMLGTRRLVNLWSKLSLDGVLGFGLRQAISLPKLIGGGGTGAGLFDVSPMIRLVEREIPWRAISRVLRLRHLDAFSVTATEISTGRTVIFMQVGPETALPTRAPPRTLIRADRIGPRHALASAAMPLLFPPVRIGQQLYMDGGVRQNTPIAPALRLGATHVFVVGTSRLVRGVAPHVDHSSAPSAAVLVGKIMNALLLDHLDTDLGMVNLLNDLLASGEQAFGPDFLSRLRVAAESRGGHHFRPIETFVIRPTEPLGQLAAEYVRSGRLKGAGIPRRLLQILDAGSSEDADLASYLLFDGGFARQLVELGRADARARRLDLLEFFGSIEEEPPAPAGGLDSGSVDWPFPPTAIN
jgi:NTE family protein